MSDAVFPLHDKPPLMTLCITNCTDVVNGPLLPVTVIPPVTVFDAT